MNFQSAVRFLTSTESEPDMGGSMSDYEFPESGPRVRQNGKRGESAMDRETLLALGHIVSIPAPPRQMGKALLAWAKMFATRKSKDTWGLQHEATLAEVFVLGTCLCEGKEPVVSSNGKMIPLLSYVEASGLVEGNGKLPFAAYSEFPLVTCPGAGGGAIDQGRSWGFYVKTKTPGCAGFCYSFKGARNATVVRRWLRLTLSWALYGIDHTRAVMRCFERHYASKGVRIMRLFVDGDFRNTQAITDWMKAISENSAVTVYGYSKSWKELLEYARTKTFPRNYVLNISSGSRHSEALKNEVKRIPCARGEFIDVSMEPVYKALEAVRGKDAVSQERHENARMLHRAEVWASEWNERLMKAWKDPTERARLGLTTAKIRKAKELLGSQIGQAVEGQYLVRALKDLHGQGVICCPIDCGSCPAQMRPDWHKVRVALISGDRDAFFQLAERTWTGAEFKGSVIHHCGNAKLKANIVIPVH